MGSLHRLLCVFIAIKNPREATRSPRMGHDLKRTYDIMEGSRGHPVRDTAPYEGQCAFFGLSEKNRENLEGFIGVTGASCNTGLYLGNCTRLKYIKMFGNWTIYFDFGSSFLLLRLLAVGLYRIDFQNLTWEIFTAVDVNRLRNIFFSWQAWSAEHCREKVHMSLRTELHSLDPSCRVTVTPTTIFRARCRFTQHFLTSLSF